MSSSKKYRLVQRSLTMQERLPQGKYRKLSEEEITLDWLRFSRPSFLGDGRNTSPKLMSNVVSLDPIDTVLMTNQPDWSRLGTTRSMPENVDSTSSLKRRQPKVLKVFSHRLSRKSPSKEDVPLSVTEEVCDCTVPEKKYDNERGMPTDESHDEHIQPNVSTHEESPRSGSSEEQRKGSPSSSSTSSSSSLSSEGKESVTRTKGDSVPIDEYLLKYGLVPKSVKSNCTRSDRNSDRINGIADRNREKLSLKDGEERKNISINKIQIDTNLNVPVAESTTKVEPRKRIKNSSITSSASASSVSTSESKIKLTSTKKGIVPINDYLNPRDFVSRSVREMSTKGARENGIDGIKGSDSDKGNAPAVGKKNLESAALLSKSDLDLVQKRKQKDKRKSYDPTRYSGISVGIQAPDDNAITFWDVRYNAQDLGTHTKPFKMHALVSAGTGEIKLKADTNTVNMRRKSEVPLMVREIPEPSLSIVQIEKATLAPREVEVMHSESTKGPRMQRKSDFENLAQDIGPSTHDIPKDKANYISLANSRHDVQGNEYTTVSFREKQPILDDATLDSLQESSVDDAACLSPANTIESNNEQMPSGSTAAQITREGGYSRAVTNDNISRPGRPSTSSNSSSSSSSCKSSEGSSLRMDRANACEKAHEDHSLGHAKTEKAGNGKMDAVHGAQDRKNQREHPMYEHIKSETETIKSNFGHRLGGDKKIFIYGVFPSSNDDGLEQEKLKSASATSCNDDHSLGETRKLQFDSATSFEEDYRECKEGQQKSRSATNIEKDHLYEANENTTSDTDTSASETNHSENEGSSSGQAKGGKVKIKTRVDENDNHGTWTVNETDDRNIGIETEIACGDMGGDVTQSTFIRPESPASSDISREIAKVSDPYESDHSTSSTSSFNSSSSSSTSSGSKKGDQSSHKLEETSPKLRQDIPTQITYNGLVYASEDSQDKLLSDAKSDSSPKSKNVSEKLPDQLRSELPGEKILLGRENWGKDVSLSNSYVSTPDNSSEKMRRRRQSSSSNSSQSSRCTEELDPRSIQSDLQGDPYIRATRVEFSGGKGSDEFGQAANGVRIEQLRVNQEEAMPSASAYNYSDIHSALNTLDNVIHTSGVHVRTHSGNAGTLRTAGGHFVVVAIDFGTTYSGYAFSFTRDPESIYMMRKWEGGDPGVINQKTLTTLLMTPDEKFHSFGYAARDFFHDLDPEEATNWLYYEKFKMMLHYSANLCSTTLLTASNGRQVPALTVFSHALRFFKERVLEELSDQSGMKIINEDIRWVLTVPAIWKAQAKQFMRQASYDAGLVSPEFPDQLLVALEPEVASIYCRKLRLHQLIPEGPPLKSPLRSPRKSQPEIPLNKEMACKDFITDSNLQRSPCCSSSNLQRSPCCSSLDIALSPSDTVESLVQGMRYMVVDCGGGTVDITVHEIDTGGRLKELHRATGGPYGSVGVDLEFEKLLQGIFGVEFIEQFKLKCPAGWVDLMINFESRKRSASPYSASSLNVSLPFSFINYYKKCKGGHIESIIKKYGDKEIRWSSQGMLRLSLEAMRRLFLPTLDRIKQTIGDVLNDPETRGVKYLFLVGGFAESAFLQTEVRQEFRHILQVIIPQEVSLTIVKGAVLFGLDPTVVNVRRSRLTYGVGVLNRFDPNKHPIEKKVTKDGIDWCTDVFDKFVMIDQPIAQGDVVVRSYTPARPGQKTSQINVYCTEQEDIMFITDIGVKKCGTLALDLEPLSLDAKEPPIRREIQTRMMFGETEIKVSAIDMSTGRNVYCSIDFLNK